MVSGTGDPYPPMLTQRVRKYVHFHHHHQLSVPGVRVFAAWNLMVLFDVGFQYTACVSLAGHYHEDVLTSDPHHDGARDA